MIRVLLADDQALVRGALAALLDLEPDLTVVAQLEDGTGVAQAVLEHRVDVALLDIEMPGMDGIETVRAVQQAVADAGVQCRCLMVTRSGGRATCGGLWRPVPRGSW